MIFRSQLGSAVSDRGSWPALLLMLLGVLGPTACVLWFMKQGVVREQEIERQRLAQAYHNQLLLLPERLDSFWAKRATALQAHSAEASAAQLFARSVTAGLADSVVYLDAEGTILYPAPAARSIADPYASSANWREARALEDQRQNSAASRAYEQIAKAEKNDSIAAQAWQAEIRCLVQNGDKEAAARTIEREFLGKRFRRATNLQGRNIAADEQLLLLNLTSRQDSRYLTAVRRLHSILEDYEHWVMPAAQRFFLMQEMRTRNLNAEYSQFPTYDAESLAQRFLEAGQVGRGAGPVLELTALPDIWKFTSDHGKVIALYRTATIRDAMQAMLNESYSASGLQVAVAPPAAQLPHFDERAPAGSRLPGWQIGIRAQSERSDALARRWMASYLWVGFLVIAIMAIAAAAAGQALQRQMRLANLKADLVAAVSHELKTPLSSMRLLVDSLLEDEEFDPSKTRDYLELIARENLRLSSLIDNFLTFSRMDSKREKLIFRETQPGEIIQAAFAVACERFQSSSECRIDVKITPGLPSLRADENALVTAVLNLLDNAYKFTPRDKHIQLSAYCESGKVCFAVADNGMGIPLREQKKVFHRFYQVNRQLSREAGGCGLGLSIVDFIAKAHHGRVRVTSRPGAGSTFIISVPFRIAGEGSV